MVRYLMMFLAAGLVMTTGFGCGIKARGYVAERERVDQGSSGNAGFLMGQGASEVGRPTRKVYVLEFEREKKPEQKKIETAKAPVVHDSPTTESKDTPAAKIDEAVREPLVPEEAAAAMPEPAAGSKITVYTVQKDDTLQKISKKVYNTYGQWRKIYEANKDKIKNPNFVKPGTVLTIPQE